MKYITPVPPGKARGVVRDVYRQIKNDFGAVVDPFAVHSISPRLLAAVWAACRESEVVPGAVPRERKEAVAVAVSQRNQTPFCIDAHVVMLHALKQHEIAHAILDGSRERIPDPTRSILEWTTTSCRVRPAGAPPPVAGAAAAEVIGTVVFFHYMNRIAIVLLDETPLPSSQRWLKPYLSRIAGWYFSFAARRPKTPGDSLAFLPDSELPADMAWAAASPSVAGAWARFAHEVDRQGEAALSPAVRQLATEQIRLWHGNTDAVDAAAVKKIVDGLHPDERGAGTLVLLTALAPREVDDQSIRAFADPVLEQEKLLGALSWASFTAARRVGALLDGPTDDSALRLATV